MSLSKQDVKKAAALARIEVTDQEVENALDPLKQVFTLIKEMQKKQKIMMGENLENYIELCGLSDLKIL